MSLRLAADFDADDWVGYQRVTDSPNLFGAASVKISDLPRIAQGTGGSAAQGPNVPTRYSDERAKYGKDNVRWVTGTVQTANILIGFNGVASWTIGANVLPSDTYTAVIWAKRASGNNNTFRLAAYRDSAVLIANGTSQALSVSAWTKFTLTFSFTATASDDRIYLMFQRTNGDGTTQNIDVTGAMLVAGSTAPEWFNCGSASLLQDLTPYWMDGRWQSGFVRAHQYVAPLGKAELTLINDDRRFSPEYASGPMYGSLLPNILVQIADPDVGIWWTGWADSWMPEPGPTRNQRAMLSATDARRFMAKKLPVMELYATSGGYTTVVPYLIIGDLVDSFSVPNTTAGLPDFTGAGTAWGERVAWDETLTSGGATYVYADNTPYDFDAVKVIGDILGAVQGKLWFNREACWRIRGAQGDTTPAIYNDVGALWMEAGYEISEIINQCEVIAHLRKFNVGGGPYTVWELDTNITLDAGEVEDFRIYFTHSNEAKILAGAGGTFGISGTLSSGTFGTAATNVVAALSDIGAQSALLTLTNTSGVSRTVTAITVTAMDRAVQLREVSKTREDSASITANGTLGERLKYNFISQRSWAKRLARYRVTRFKDPTYWMPWFTIHAEKNPTEAYRCYIGAPIYLSDAQTGHGAYYAVIGEQHTVKSGLTDHRVRVYTEPLYETAVADTPTA